MSLRKKYRHVFFDLDNTLWDFKKNSFFAMQVVFNGLGLDRQVGFDQFFDAYSEINHSLWSDYRNKLVTKKELIRKRFQLTFDKLKIENIVPEKMNELYLEEMPNQKNLEPGALETVKYLKSKQYNLHIITNGFSEVQHKKLESSGLSPYFDKVFISEEVKIPKPGRGIFEFAVKSANARKKESIMVGDDWEVDIRGAVGFGIDAIWYSPDGRPEAEGVVGAQVFYVKKLFGLKEIL